MGASCSYNFNVDRVYENIIEVFIRDIPGVPTFKEEMKESFMVYGYSGRKLIAKGAVTSDILKFPSPIVKDNLIVKVEKSKFFQIGWKEGQRPSVEIV